MIQIIQMQDPIAWDNYVANHPKSNAYQAFHWQTIIAKAYGYKTYALAAVIGNTPLSAENPAAIVGLLPLVHLKSPLFGNRLVSMPYFDHGGIIVDSPEHEIKLIHAAVALGRELRIQRFELRHLDQIASLKLNCAKSDQDTEVNAVFSGKSLQPGWSVRSHKVRLLLALPGTSDELLKTFKSKLRSQINRPIKAGLIAKIGGMELIDDFYHVFSINMRDLGSPVHAKALPQSVMTQFSEEARIAVVYKAGEPVASAIMVGFKDVMINPWASALRQHSKDSPNMLLYWQMLSYASDHGFRYFDFGRSTPQEGTYRFKIQWGAQPQPMYWYTLWFNGKTKSSGPIHTDKADSKSYALTTALWRRLPLAISRIIGPMIRKHIDL
jgi:FemAB-related protein (PEP-CTERM system-associated)